MWGTEAAASLSRYPPLLGCDLQQLCLPWVRGRAKSLYPWVAAGPPGGGDTVHTRFPVLSPSPQEAGCGGLNNGPSDVSGACAGYFYGNRDFADVIK